DDRRPHPQLTTLCTCDDAADPAILCLDASGVGAVEDLSPARARIREVGAHGRALRAASAAERARAARRELRAFAYAAADVACDRRARQPERTKSPFEDGVGSIA